MNIMHSKDDSHVGRDLKTSDSASDTFDRRSILRTLGTGLVAFGGTSGSALAQTDQDSESGDRLFEVSYGADSELVAPFNGTEPITDVYDYSGVTAGIELQKEDTARLFLYDGPNGLSLGTVLDSTSSDDGGQTGYEIDGFPADGAWVIKDDPGDTYGTKPAWSWNSGGNTDGGVIRGGFDGEFEITITPELNEGRDDPQNDEDGIVNGWEFVHGEFENGSFQNVEVIDLEVNDEPQSVTITPSGQQDSGPGDGGQAPVELSLEAPETVQPGETVTVTAELTNRDVPEPSSGSIELTPVPEPLSLSSDSENPVFLGFAGNALPAVGESVTQQFEIAVSQEAAVEQELTLETEATLQNSEVTRNATTTQTVTITDQQDPVERFDQNGEPGIQGDEVLDAISEFNEGGDVEATDVLDVISAFNENSG